MTNIEYIKSQLPQYSKLGFTDMDIEIALEIMGKFRQEPKFISGGAKNPGIDFYLSMNLDIDISDLIEESGMKDWNQIRSITQKMKLFLFRNPEVSDNEIRNHFTNLLKEYPFKDFDSTKIEGYVDYRLKENFDEFIARNLLTRALIGDTDHYHDCWVGAEYLNLDNEQKAWHALLFGYTYRAQFASLAIQLWPYPHTENIHDIAYWCSQVYDEKTDKFSKMEPGTGPDNYNLIIVGKDCKYSKNTFPKFFKSVQDYSEGGKLFEKLKRAATVSTNPNENYRSLDKEIRDNFVGIGRFMSFLVMQQLYAYFSWPINGYLCGLEEEGTWSCRIGQYAYIHGLDSMIEEEIIGRGKKIPSKELAKTMEEDTKSILEYLNSKLPFESDIFEYESVTCEISDKYLLKQREFSGWTSTEKSELCYDSYKLWKENFKPTPAYPNCPDLNILLIPQIAKRLDFISWGWLDKNWMKTLNHCGMSTLSSKFIPSEINIYSVLPIKSPEEIVNQEMKDLVDSIFTQEQIEEIRKKYDPRRYLRWKKNPIETDGYSILNEEEKEFIRNLDSVKLVHERV